jgi:hypothetical protein
MRHELQKYFSMEFRIPIPNPKPKKILYFPSGDFFVFKLYKETMGLK